MKYIISIFILGLLLISCKSIDTPIINEQLTMNNEQVAMSNQTSGLEESNLWFEAESSQTSGLEQIAESNEQITESSQTSGLEQVAESEVTLIDDEDFLTDIEDLIIEIKDLIAELDEEQADNEEHISEGDEQSDLWFGADSIAELTAEVETLVEEIRELRAILDALLAGLSTQGTENEDTEPEIEIDEKEIEEIAEFLIEDTEPEIEIVIIHEDLEESPPEVIPPVAPQPPPLAVTPPVTPPQTQTPAVTPPVTPQVTPPQQTQPQRPPAPTAPAPTAPSLAEERNDADEETFPSLNEFHPIRIAPAERTDELSPNNNIIFSRIVRVTVGQVLEIPFRGNGWVYLGELASRRGIVYNSRRNDPEGSTFIFNIEEAGTFALKFFREDFTRGYILNDHVQVIAGDAPAASAGWFNPPNERTRIVAEPRWPSAIEEAEIQRGAASSQNDRETIVFSPTITQTTDLSMGQQSVIPQEPVTQSTEDRTNTSPQSVQPTAPSWPQMQSPQSIPSQPTELPQQPAIPESITERQETVSPNTLLQRARETFNNGNVAPAITMLDQYMSHFPGGSDEAFWLYGQFYEANSPNRNILLALEYYRRLVNEYPQSSRLPDARRRISYLERFYINIQ